MFELSLLTISLLASSIAAKQCVNVTVPVSISARQGVFDVPTLREDLDATVFSLNYNSIKANFTEKSLTGYATIKGDYHISAKFCQPDVVNGSNPTVQVLIHGIGFDKTYWDIPYNNFNYSYIDVAVDQYGFSTLSIDRFGIGNSSHADPLNVIQVPAETLAIYEVTKKLRDGTVPHVPHIFKKVVHVGHSFGSVLTYNLVASYPDTSDGIILSGYSQNASFFSAIIAGWNSKIARLNQPLRFGDVGSTAAKQALSKFISPEFNTTSFEKFLAENNISAADVQSVIESTELGDLITGFDLMSQPQAQNLPTGYLTWSDASSNLYGFLYPGFFDPKILTFTESTKMPYTLGELLTIGSSPKTTTFKGPVQVITGNEDTIFCNGGCLDTGDPALESIPAAAKASFPEAKLFETYIQPNTGHGINAHYNSTGAYKVMQSFLIRQGLASA